MDRAFDQVHHKRVCLRVSLSSLAFRSSSLGSVFARAVHPDFPDLGPTLSRVRDKLPAERDGEGQQEGCRRSDGRLHWRDDAGAAQGL